MIRIVSIFRALSIITALVTLPLANIPSIAIFTSICCHIYLCYRLPYSLDGADQMILINLFGAWVMSLDSGDGCMLKLGATFIAMEAAIAYLTAGLTKLNSASWRSGRALIGITTSAMFGNELLPRLMVKSKTRTRILSALVYFGLIFTGIAILIGDVFAIVAVVLSLLFHIGVAIMMDLNLFVWAFGASIPSIIYMGDWGNRLALARCIF